MFVILSYDVASKRVAKVLKICRRYLTHRQLSVFDGMITEAKLEKLKSEIAKVVRPDEDELCIYKFGSLKYSSKDYIGSDENGDNII